MKIALSTALVLAGSSGVIDAFAPSSLSNARHGAFVLKGYLDDLSKELYAPADEPDVEKTREATDAKATDRYGVSDWQDFVDFEEFDGGDGQVRMRLLPHSSASRC